MKFGLSNEQSAQIRSVLSKHPEVEKALIYGSRAKGNYRPSSDIDLSLMGKALGLSRQLIIDQEIDDLLLPYKVDLCIFSTIENPDLKEHINRVGEVFFDRN